VGWYDKTTLAAIACAQERNPPTPMHTSGHSSVSCHQHLSATPILAAVGCQAPHQQVQQRQPLSATQLRADASFEVAVACLHARDV